MKSKRINEQLSNTMQQIIFKKNIKTHKLIKLLKLVTHP